MKVYSTIKLIPLIFLFLGSYIINAQTIPNMSFEGAPQQDNAPDGWGPCNNFSTPDTQPGFWEVSKEPSDGDTYLGLVTRGNLGPYANHTEAAEAQLLNPLEKGKGYDFSLDLALSKKWGHFIDFGSTFLKYDNPAKLRIYGGSSSCEKLELLWESPTIDHTDWQTYTMTLLAESKDIYYLILEAAYISESTYFGNVLIDNFTECSIDLEIPSEKTICENEPYSLDVTIPNGNYVWQDGSTDPNFTIRSAGVYSVEVSNQCTSVVYEIKVETRNCICDTAVPIAVSGFDTLVCENESINLNVITPGGSYVWENGSVEPVREVNTEGIFSVEVSNGCETELIKFTISLAECSCELVAPNVFTPNDDKTNETFVIKGSSNIDLYELQIFNRWGKLVYQANSLSTEWDGTSNGVKVPAGVYFWIADVSCTIANSTLGNRYSGQVTVLR